MKKKRSKSTQLDSSAIDARYGLEPVIDVAAPGGGVDGGGGDNAFLTVHCPYCGEAFDTRIDASEGTASYIEDCQICCQPIEMRLAVDESGQVSDFEARRLDQ
jgi:Cysteine-rich CPXCG